MTDSSGRTLSTADRIRLRRTVQRWFVPLVALLLLVATLGAGTVYATHIEPGETTTERVVSTWSDRADFSHSAAVQRDTAVFSNDTVLRNRPVYYTRVSPDVDVEYASGYTASDGGSLDVETVLELRWQGSDSDGNVLWQVTDPIAASEWTDVGPDETKRIEASFNATDVDARTASIQEELGSSRGSVDTVFLARTTRSGTINGESIRHTRTHTLPFDHRETTYGFLEPDIETEAHEQTEAETVPVVYGPARSAGSILLTVVPLFGAAGMVVAHKKRVFELSAGEAAALEHALAYEEFDEWITAGTLPASVSERQPVEVTSLRGVVDVAIDSGRRVIEDGNRYLIVTPEMTYLYVNDAPSLDSVSATTDANTESASVPPCHDGDDGESDSSDTGFDGGDRRGDTTSDPARNGRSTARTVAATGVDTDAGPSDGATSSTGSDPSDEEDTGNRNGS